MATKARAKTKKPRYAYRGTTFPVPAQKAGEELARIERAVGLTRANVVAESRDPDAVLHPCFTWDRDAAAQKCWEFEAGQIIRCVQVVSVADDSDEPVRRPAFVSVIDEGSGKREYVSSAKLLDNEQYREVALRDALAQLEGLRQRYGHLQELAGVWQAINDVSESA